MNEEKVVTTTKKNAQSQTNIEISSLNGQETVAFIQENNDANLKDNTHADSNSAKEEINEKLSSKNEIKSVDTHKNELISESQPNDSFVVMTKAQEKQINILSQELETSKETIEKLRRNESKLRERYFKEISVNFLFSLTCNKIFYFK
jgi:hypothetical protein